MALAPRFHCPAPLHTGATLELPAGAARHVQVLRMQPGGNITLFGGAPSDGTAGQAGHGDTGEYDATILAMGRRDVTVRVGDHRATARETTRRVDIALGMPANDRMDWLVEKATELGVAGLQPLMTERSVLRLDGERAQKKSTHWRSIAVAACEQCGRNVVPAVHDALAFTAWLRESGPRDGTRLLLSFLPGALLLRDALAQGRIPAAGAVTLLSGPEGGLGPAEEALALVHGFVPVHLGPRVLRAETAAIAALTLLG